MLLYNIYEIYSNSGQMRVICDCSFINICLIFNCFVCKKTKRISELYVIISFYKFFFLSYRLKTWYPGIKEDISSEDFLNWILYSTDILLCSKTEYARKYFGHFARMDFYGTTRTMRQIKKNCPATEQSIGRLFRLSLYFNYSFQCAGTSYCGHL